MSQRELEDLSPDECFRLLAAADIGRLVYQDDLGPLAVPVNYAMAGQDTRHRLPRRGWRETNGDAATDARLEVDHLE